MVNYIDTTSNDWEKKKKPCIPGMNPTQSFLYIVVFVVLNFYLDFCILVCEGLISIFL